MWHATEKHILYFTDSFSRVKQNFGESQHGWEQPLQRANAAKDTVHNHHNISANSDDNVPRHVSN